MRPYLFLALLFLLCTCAPAAEAEPTVVTAQLRYQERSKTLSAEVAVRPDYPTRPTLFNDAMEPRLQAGTGSYRSKREMAFPASVRLGIPTGAPDERTELKVSFHPVGLDSLPRSLRAGAAYRFPVGSAPLAPGENLILFLEPTDRSAPRQFLLEGPTVSADFQLPAPATKNIPPGTYGAYLIKQQLLRDTLPGVIASVQTEYFTRTVDVRVTE